MQSGLKDTYRMKVFPKGQVVIPVELRKKYRIEVGDKIKIKQRADGILLTPDKSPKNKVPLTDSLYGIFSKYRQGKPALTKKEIKKATADMFTKDWEK